MMMMKSFMIKSWKLDPQSSCDESDWLTHKPSSGTKTSCTLVPGLFSSCLFPSPLGLSMT